MAHQARPLDEVVHVEKMAAGGDAIAHLADGRVVFVDGALPGETVRVALTTSKRDFAKGVAAEVLQPSPHRVVPPCPELAKGCGGCGWQHAAPTAQLQWKADVVTDALRRTAKMPDADIRIGGSVSPWGYRTSMRLAATNDGRVGLRAGSSHRVVALDSCMVAHPSLAALLPAARLAGGEELSVRVSVATGGATAWSSSGGVRFEGSAGHVAIGPDATLFEDVAGVRLRVTAASFFQSGPAAAELLVGTVRDVCGDALRDLRGPLLDAYGGIGLFAATLGVGETIVVESSPSSCADAAVNLGDLATVHRTPFEEWTPRPVELAVVDPARAGLGRAATDVLAATGAPVVVLVSCDPVSLARDTTLLAAHGYRHAGSIVLDLFPNTPHVEVVTRFERS
ncbi:MAG TPA: TRAM domain-containing protein [Ilumatobacteraceae bacterium]|nr:TRAM domain-containing protein [Ilumatobacteraceae bacterium]HRB02876.1 TRAM domain-containing protein [Ilumatobacteraceae bacterium]